MTIVIEKLGEVSCGCAVESSEYWGRTSPFIGIGEKKPTSNWNLHGIYWDAGGDFKLNFIFHLRLRIILRY